MSVLNFIKKTISLDLRSMALYRFLIGLIVMTDVLYRWPDLVNFYTDIGLVPRSIFVSEMSMPWSFSLHLANGSHLFACIMFSIHLIFGLMLMLGYKTRWAIIGAFIMTVSVHNRNWLVNNGGDDVLRAILFISIFLPLNRYFSIDSALKKDKVINNSTNDYFSTWGLVFFLQAFCIYFVSYILKDHPVWRKDMTAMFYSSRLDIFATPLSLWLRNHDGLLKLLTIFSIFLEWLGPLVLIGSFVFARFWWIARTLLVFTFWGFHFGIFLTMTIGIFPFICMAMWSIFLPGTFWDRLSGYFRFKKFDKLTLYYDGDCGFCLKGVRILREFFLLPEVKILKAQDHPVILKEMVKNHSWVVENDEKIRFYHFSGWIELTKHSPILFLLAPLFSLRPVFWFGQKLYVWISNHRELMGKFSQFLSFSDSKKEIKTWRFLIEGMGAFLFMTLLMWNLTTIKRYHIKSPFFQSVTRWLHLYQEWNMFSPFPKMDNVWVEIPGTLSDGSQIDVLTGDPDIYSVKDKAFYRQIPNEHWRKFYLNLSERESYSRYYGSYLCRLWNERKIRKVENTTLRKMEIIVFSQMNLIDGNRGGISRKFSWKHWCFDEDMKRDNPGK